MSIIHGLASGLHSVSRRNWQCVVLLQCENKFSILSDLRWFDTPNCQQCHAVHDTEPSTIKRMKPGNGTTSSSGQFISSLTTIFWYYGNRLTVKISRGRFLEMVWNLTFYFTLLPNNRERRTILNEKTIITLERLMSNLFDVCWSYGNSLFFSRT